MDKASLFSIKNRMVKNRKYNISWEVLSEMYRIPVDELKILHETPFKSLVEEKVTRTRIERARYRPSRTIKDDNYLEKKRDYDREYRRNNYQARLSNNLRGRLRMALKSQGTSKTNKTMCYIGCDKKFLISYLASKFKKGMSWGNYGEWHIDHIQPLASFDLRKEEHIHAAMHWSNLQPLWADENRKKSARFEGKRYLVSKFR